MNTSLHVTAASSSTKRSRDDTIDDDSDATDSSEMRYRSERRAERRRDREHADIERSSVRRRRIAPYQHIITEPPECFDILTEPRIMQVARDVCDEIGKRVGPDKQCIGYIKNGLCVASMAWPHPSINYDDLGAVMARGNGASGNAVIDVRLFIPSRLPKFGPDSNSAEDAGFAPRIDVNNHLGALFVESEAAAVKRTSNALTFSEQDKRDAMLIVESLASCVEGKDKPVIQLLIQYIRRIRPDLHGGITVQLLPDSAYLVVVPKWTREFSFVEIKQIEHINASFAWCPIRMSDIELRGLPAKKDDLPTLCIKVQKHRYTVVVSKHHEIINGQSTRTDLYRYVE